MTSLAALPAEREKTHGQWAHTARIAARLKAVAADEWNRRIARGLPAPSAGQLESLDLACTKMARILSGDPAFPDHWRDLSHYLSEEFAGAPAPPRMVEQSQFLPIRWATEEELRAQRESRRRRRGRSRGSSNHRPWSQATIWRRRRR